MFSFRFGESLNVHTASAFSDKEGNPRFVIILMENENQPEGLERKSQSKSQIKIWGNGVMPETLHNNSVIQIESAVGFDWKHVARKNRYNGETITDRNGYAIYDDVIELVGPVIKVIDPIENTKKSKGKKAEG